MLLIVVQIAVMASNIGSRPRNSKWRRLLLWLCAVFFCILFIFNSSALFSKSDKYFIEAFKKKGIELHAGTLNIASHHLHLFSVGKKECPTLVFIHGSPGGWDDYRYYLEDSVLRLKYRIIAIDRTGFGGSDAGMAMHLQEQADIIGQYLKQIQNGQAIYLIGHSYGGPLVALLAADYPHVIKKIVIVAGALSPSLEDKENWRPFFIQRPFRYLLPSDAQTSNEELWYLKKDLIGLAKKLPMISCPIDVLHATNDMLVDYRNTDYIKRYCSSAPKVTIISFSSGNHFLPFNRQKEIVRLLNGLQ